MLLRQNASAGGKGLKLSVTGASFMLERGRIKLILLALMLPALNLIDIKKFFKIAKLLEEVKLEVT